jgi:CRISPR-associated endonuclease Cas2
MGVYLLAYDLVEEKKNPHHDYQVLWDELNRLGAQRTQYSLWLVEQNNTPQEVRNHFKRFVDDNDRLWVAKLFENGLTYSNAMAGTKKWLEANPPETR